MKALTIPLPSARVDMPDDPAIRACFESVLKQEGLTLSQIKLKHYREPFFSKGERAGFYVPEGLQHEVGWDKLNKGHRKLKLTFTLPRGSYATLLVKRVCAGWKSCGSIPPRSTAYQALQPFDQC